MAKKLFLMNKDNIIAVDVDKDTNTNFGLIKSKQLNNAKKGKLISTHKGEKFRVIEPTYTDLLKKIIRLPQIITPKDIGSIIMYGGVNSKSKVLDIGTGSGFTACVLASIAIQGEVISYEKRKDFAKIANKNKELFGVDNLKIINKEVKPGVVKGKFDIIVLDLPDPWNIIPFIVDNLEVGGRIIVYLPSIIQVERVLRRIESPIVVDRIIQNIEIPWKEDMTKDILRPESSIVLHTGFIIVLRKFSD